MNKLIQKIKDGTAAELLRELGWVAGYGRKYSFAIGWYILLGVVGTVLGLIASVISKDIIDIVTGRQTGYVVWAAVAFVTMHLAKIGLTALTGRISAKVQLQVSHTLRAEIFRKITLAQWEPLSTYHSGDLISRSSRDVDAVAGSVIGWLPALIVSSLQLIGTFLVLFHFDRTLALLALASAPVTLLASGFLGKRIRSHSKRMRRIGSEMTAFHTEAFQNIQFIKAFSAIDIYEKKLADKQQQQRDAALEYNRFSLLTSAFLSLIGMVVGGLCFFWSVYRLWGNHITFGEMTLFLQLSGSLSGAFSGLVSLIPAAITAATAAGRIMEITQLPAEDTQPPEALVRILQSKNRHIDILADNVSFSYTTGKAVFQKACLQADSGEIIALVGPSGGGKTTMLRLLLGMLQPQAGTIRFSGGDPRVTLDISPSTRRLFAYVPQDNTLFSGTIAENLRITNPDASDEQLTAVLKAACAYEFVQALPKGLYSPIGERGNGLSEGQIQRLSVARALLSDAPVLLLDEATSALDWETEQTLLRNIMEYRKDRTCIVTTHRPSVLDVCDRVYHIENCCITN